MGLRSFRHFDSLFKKPFSFLKKFKFGKFATSGGARISVQGEQLLRDM